MTDFSQEEMKDITKQALKEWLDEKFLEFGRWAFGSLAALAFVGVIYFILRSHGWTKH